MNAPVEITLLGSRSAMTPDDETLNRILDVQALKFPPKPRINDVRWERYVDSIGEDALMVWVILDDATKYEDMRGMRTPLERTIHRALLDAGIQLFPIMRFTTEAELVESAAAED